MGNKPQEESWRNFQLFLRKMQGKTTDFKGPLGMASIIYVSGWCSITFLPVTHIVAGKGNKNWSVIWVPDWFDHKQRGKNFMLKKNNHSWSHERTGIKVVNTLPLRCQRCYCPNGTAGLAIFGWAEMCDMSGLGLGMAPPKHLIERGEYHTPATNVTPESRGCFIVGI